MSLADPTIASLRTNDPSDTIQVPRWKHPIGATTFANTTQAMYITGAGTVTYRLKGEPTADVVTVQQSDMIPGDIAEITEASATGFVYGI